MREIVEEVAAAGDAALPARVSVERKGLCLTVHHRHDPSLEPESRAWFEARAEDTGLVVPSGPDVLRVAAAAKRDKGTVLAERAAAAQVCSWATTGATSPPSHARPHGRRGDDGASGRRRQR